MTAPVVYTRLAQAPPEVHELLLSTWRAGGVAVYPTDTLYGLGGIPTPSLAERVSALKGRVEGRPLPLLGSSLGQFERLGIPLPAAAAALAARFWPGPLTIVVPVPAGSALADLAHEGSLGIRVPAAPYLLRVLEDLGSPVIGTSANPSGYAGVPSATEVSGWFAGSVELCCLTRDRLAGTPSTVVGFADGALRVIREGAIAHSALLSPEGPP